MKIHLANNSTSNVQGWFPCTVENPPSFGLLGTPDANVVIGTRAGLDTWHADVYTGLAPGERKVIDLAQAAPGEYRPAPIPTVDLLGGVAVRIGGVRMHRKSCVINGAGYDLHYMARVGRLLLVHLWLHWYPDSPAWCSGRIMVCASNPNVPDLVEAIPHDFRLTVGETDVFVPGLPTAFAAFGQQVSAEDLIAAGDWLANGAARALSFVAIFADHASEHDRATAMAWCAGKVCIRGVQNLTQFGNPLLPENFDAKAWSDGLLPQVIERQHDWLPSVLDPAPDSGATGWQGPAQSLAGGPAMADDPSALAVLSIAALDCSWPMFHFEFDGRPLRWEWHQDPPLRMFRGQVNFPISLDKLGKPRAVTLGESHGYSGPEDEHAFDFVAWHAARLTGDPAMQVILEAWATHFLHRWVVTPPGNWLSTPRAIGWLGFLAAELYRNLADRELAAVVAARFQQVVDQLVLPQMGDDWWGWLTDSRIGANWNDLRAIVWQAEVMCVGLYVGGMATGHSPSVEFAYHMAEQIVAKAWFKDATGNWRSRDIIAQDGHEITVQDWLPGSPSAIDSYRHFGFKACDVLLRKDPSHVAAGEIWRQRYAEARGDLKALSWFLPGTQPAGGA